MTPEARIAALEALKLLEWCDTDGYVSCCPACRGLQPFAADYESTHGHRPTCYLALAIVALTAPPAPGVTVTGWQSFPESKPRLTKTQRQESAFGVQVLIHPPHTSEGASPAHVAFYGCRYSIEPAFYIYGRLIDVTHWQPLPSPPAATTGGDAPTPGDAR